MCTFLLIADLLNRRLWPAHGKINHLKTGQRSVGGLWVLWDGLCVNSCVGLAFLPLSLKFKGLKVPYPENAFLLCFEV